MVRLPRFIGAFRIHDEQKTSALSALGDAECERLRERVHGRPVPLEEVFVQIRPFLRRHVIAHTRQRLIDRLPVRHVDVNELLLGDDVAAVRPELGAANT
jgi:hypothetical protein